MKNLDAQKQIEYLENCTAREKIKAAENREILPEVADYLVDCEMDEKFKESLYQTLFFRYDTNIWASTIAKVARRTEKISVLYDIAQNKNTDIETLKYLMGLGKPFVNYGLACNKKLPIEMLDSIADEADEDDTSIALAILRNDNVTEEIKAKVLKKYENHMWFRNKR